jgi:diguanylate cyclase (GGDEF)-like protein/PAS domain S-box-containing protein
MPLPVFQPDAAVPVSGGFLSGSPQATAVIDGAGRIVSANPLFSGAAGLVDADGQRIAPPIAEALARRATNNSPDQHTVSVEGDQGTRIFELLVMPLADGVQRLIIAIDRTLEVNIRNALVESRARFKDLVAISADCAWETAADGTFSAITPKGLVGYSAERLIGSRPADLLDPSLPPPAILPFTTPAPLENVELWLRHIDGPSLCFKVTAVPLYDQSGAWRGARGVCQDITEFRRQQSALALQQNRERLFTRITSLFRGQADPDDMLRVAASTCTHGFGASGCQIFVTTASLAKGITHATYYPAIAFGTAGERAEGDSIVASLTDRSHQITQVIDLDRWSVLAAPAIYGDRMVGAVLLWRSLDRPDWSESDQQLLNGVVGQVAVTIEQRSNYNVLLNVSRTDALTGLLNRRAYYEEVQRRFQRLQRDGKTAAMVYVDLDNFKAVNDVHGHDRGDEALRHLADILRTNTRGTDLVARLGGDEFAVWLDGADQDVAVKRAKVFLAAAKPLTTYSGAHDKPLQMSLGVAVYDPKTRETINDFVSRADAAMYAVKRAGKGNYAMAAAADAAK